MNNKKNPEAIKNWVDQRYEEKKRIIDSNPNDLIPEQAVFDIGAADPETGELVEDGLNMIQEALNEAYRLRKQRKAH